MVLNQKRYNFLVVGCGLFGSTFSRLAYDAGKTCLIIDKRSHIGGNCFTQNVNGINVHRYGPHIFHTSDDNVWDFVNRFAQFNNFILSPKAIHGEKMYSLPFNMNTFYEMWGVKTPEDALQIIESQRFKGTPTNLEEQALSLVGYDIYEKLIKNYTKKQWGKNPSNLPKSIIKRIPLRFTFNNNYFNDRYQGIPIGGYTKMIEKMIDGIPVSLGIDYLSNREYFDSICETIIYTGPIDEFFNYEYGSLEYRSLKFDHEILQTNNYQGTAQVNYCDLSREYTRVIEHKHFEESKHPFTIITKEYPQDYKRGMIPYYPINDQTNQSLYRKYKDRSKSLTNVVFGGRLAEYKYINMDVAVKSAMVKFFNLK